MRLGEKVLFTEHEMFEFVNGRKRKRALDRREASREDLGAENVLWVRCAPVQCQDPVCNVQCVQGTLILVY